MGRIDDLANRYVDEWAPLDPLSATFVGIAGYDHDLGDLTPEGYAALADLDRRTLDGLRDIEPDTEGERVAKEAMAERLSVSLARYEAGDIVGQLNVIESGLHSVRSAFDLMPIEGEVAAGNVASRLAQLPGALEQIKESVNHAAERGRLASTAQIVEVAKQCDMWTDPAGDNFYPELARRVIAANDRSGSAASAAAHDPDRSADLPDGLRVDLERGAAEAAAATAAFGQWLRTELAPRGAAKDAVGRERYQLASQYFLGDTVDLDETYAWGFEELARLEAEMRVVAGKVVPDGGIDEAVAELDRDPTRTIPGKEAFRDWMQQLSDQAVAELAGTHFDIPEQVRLLECRIAPTSDGSIYYTGPSEDFTRPGRMWWSVPQGITEFSTWREVTTVYHEGVPGHHLQVAQTAVRAELLNRYQRLLCWVSGHGEGWALYAENLMDELGYLEDPGDRLGMLDGSAFRAARVIVDIGLHLELEIPRDNPFGFHPGERWTPELGWEFLRAHCRIPDENLRFELNRYLGWPGQAPSYKVGERTWLRARADAKARKGTDFDLKAFHRYALDLGSLGLGPLKGALARF